MSSNILTVGLIGFMASLLTGLNAGMGFGLLIK